MRFKWAFVPVEIEHYPELLEEEQLEKLLQKCESTLNSLELIDEFGQLTSIFPSVASMTLVNSTQAVLVVGYTPDQFYTEEMHG